MKNILLFLMLVISSTGITQDKEPTDILTVGLGTGFSSFIGDLATDSKVSPLANIRNCHTFNLEHRFGNVFGAQIDAMYGSLAYNETSNTIANNRNFQTSLLQVGANLVLHLDDDIIINRDSPFSPYISMGVSYLMFDAHSDLKDKNGNKYYYWDNGTIMNLPQTQTADDTLATNLLRDYTYETQLTDSTENYSRNSVSFPLTFGLKWKFTPRIQGRIFGSYNITMTDRIDNYSENDNNDKFVYLGFSLNYVISKKDPEVKHRYDDVDFTELKKGDGDGDGVIDTKDECQNTPEGIGIDEVGCPLDSDGDGVPDYLDKQVGTRKGAQVDEMGREITDAIIAARASAKDSIETIRHETFSEDPSMQKLTEISDEIEANREINDQLTGGSKIPENIQEADLNGNGIISANEITKAIDGFFEGSNNFTVKSLHDLIDYFFEQ